MTEIDAENYSNARVLAISYIGEINSNAELEFRIQCYREYKYYVSLIQNRIDLSYDQKQEWLHTYQYKFVPITDIYGKVTGWKPWIEIGGPNDTPVIIPEYQAR